MPSLAQLGRFPALFAKIQLECITNEYSALRNKRQKSLKTCNFEILEVTAMYVTFLETSSLYLFGQERSGAYIVASSVYDMLSRIPLGLLHNEGLVQSQTNRTVTCTYLHTYLYVRNLRENLSNCIYRVTDH